MGDDLQPVAPPSWLQSGVQDIMGAPAGAKPDPAQIAASKSSAAVDFLQGLNPLHSAPQGTTSAGNALTNMGADTVNMREIFDKATSGQKGKAAAMAAGTALSTFGPMLIKGGLRGAKLLAVSKQAERDIPLMRAAAQRAAQTRKGLGGPIEVARFVENHLADVHSALDKKFEPLHKALEKEVVPFSNTAHQMVKRMALDGDRDVARIGQYLMERMQRSSGGLALEYKKAEELRRLLEHEGVGNTVAKEMSEYLDKEIDKLAQLKGLGSTRTELRGIYKQARDWAGAATANIQQNPTLLRKITGSAVGAAVGKIMGAGSHLSTEAVGAYIGEREAAKKFIKESPKLSAALDALHSTLKIRKRDIVNDFGHIGNILDKASKGSNALYAAPVGRAATSMVTQGQQQAPADAQ